MLAANPKQKLRIITIVFWILLLYIVAALVWWFIELEMQNQEMYQYKLSLLNVDDPQFMFKLDALQDQKSRHTTQFLAEGITFLALILMGAVYMYGNVRRQFRLQEQQQNFMMAVTHEFKTPIAIAKLNLETLRKHKLDETKQHKLIDTALQETERLNQLASNILVSSQLEAGRYKMSHETIDLSELLEKHVASYRDHFTDREWTDNIDKEIYIEGDPLLLQMLINNLLENAYKYSPKGSRITVQLQKENQYVFFRVIDEGEGVKDDEKQHIFEKFYRSGSEQTRKTKGTGLGLYLCSKIAEDHKAKISVSDAVPRGAIFTTRFRAQNQPS
jgi:signal transduction histidine kinase